jgi:hypothetical protein
MKVMYPVVPPTFIPTQRKQSLNSTASCMICEMIITAEPGEIWKDTLVICSAEIPSTTEVIHEKNKTTTFP